MIFLSIGAETNRSYLNFDCPHATVLLIFYAMSQFSLVFVQFGVEIKIPKIFENIDAQLFFSEFFVNPSDGCVWKSE